MEYNGTIIIKFTDGLASLKIDDGASRIPVGILDRWMRTKGVKLFRAQQRAIDKARPLKRVGILSSTPNPQAKVEVKKSPASPAPSPRSEASAPAAQPKTGPEVRKVTNPAIAAAILARQQKASPAGSDKKNEQAVADKVTANFLMGKQQPDAPHPEMDKIEAAIARTAGDNKDNSAKEENVNEAAE